MITAYKNCIDKVWNESSKYTLLNSPKAIHISWWVHLNKSQSLDTFLNKYSKDLDPWDVNWALFKKEVLCNIVMRNIIASFWLKNDSCLQAEWAFWDQDLFYCEYYETEKGDEKLIFICGMHLIIGWR